MLKCGLILNYDMNKILVFYVRLARLVKKERLGLSHGDGIAIMNLWFLSRICNGLFVLYSLRHFKFTQIEMKNILKIKLYTIFIGIPSTTMPNNEQTTMSLDDKLALVAEMIRNKTEGAKKKES